MSNNMDLDLFLNPEKQAEVLKSVQSKEKKGYDADPTIYKPTFKDGRPNVITGFFLPNPHSFTDKFGVKRYMHIASTWKHWYKEGTENIIVNCPSRMEQEIYGQWGKCPLCDFVNDKWPYVRTKEPGINDNFNKRKAKGEHIINFYIENDALCPEKNGTVVKLVLAGDVLTQLRGKLDGQKDASSGKYLIQPENLFAFPNVRRYNIIVEQSKQNSTWRNFEKSNFGDKVLFMDGDTDKIKAILAKCFDLYNDIVKPFIEEVPSTEAIKALIQSIYGEDYSSTKEEDEVVDDTPQMKTETVETKKEEAKVETKKVEVKDDEETEAVIDDIPEFNFDPDAYNN